MRMAVLDLDAPIQARFVMSIVWVDARLQTIRGLAIPVNTSRFTECVRTNVPKTCMNTQVDAVLQRNSVNRSSRNMLVAKKIRQF